MKENLRAFALNSPVLTFFLGIASISAVVQLVKIFGGP